MPWPAGPRGRFTRRPWSMIPHAWTPAVSAEYRFSERGASPRSVRATPAQDGQRGARDDLDVEPHRPVLDVVEVQPHEVVEAERRAPGDLPEARDARQHAVAAAVPGLEALVVAQRQRARADEAHLAAQHVPELGQLVDREAAQDAADRRDAGVVADLSL